MEGEGEEFKEMLNRMKAEEFREQREDRLVGLVFRKMKKNWNRGKKHHELTLRWKVFQALLMTRVQLEEF